MAISTQIEGRAARGQLRLAPPRLLSDEALAARVRAGDERAFEALYRRYRDRLYGYCASILRQPEDAEEALQSAMAGAFRSLTGVEERALEVRPWLYRIAHNQCISMLRRRPPLAAEALSGSETSPAQGPMERLETVEELAALREDLLTLPADQLGALVLRELSGLTHEQIAGVLDESPAGVKQLIYQARLGLTGMVEGRRMDCGEVRRRLSDGDGRVLRARGIGAHLRACPGCRAFRETNAARPRQLLALAAALPLAVAERILRAIQDASGGLGGGGGGAAAGTGAAASGALSGIGGGIGAKLAVVVAISAVGGSIVVGPGATRDHEPERQAPASAAAIRPASPAPVAGAGTTVAGGSGARYTPVPVSTKAAVPDSQAPPGASGPASPVAAPVAPSEPAPPAAGPASGPGSARARARASNPSPPVGAAPGPPARPGSPVGAPAQPLAPGQPGRGGLPAGVPDPPAATVPEAASPPAPVPAPAATAAPEVASPPASAPAPPAATEGVPATPGDPRPADRGVAQ
jgi:RNA polymerase sigma factor (sigma-70 family)